MSAAVLLAEIQKRGITGAAAEDIGRYSDAIFKSRATLGGGLLAHSYAIYLETLADPRGVRESLLMSREMRPAMAEMYAPELAERPASVEKDEAIDMLFAFNNYMTSAAFQGPFGIFGSTNEANALEAIGFASAAQFAPNLRIGIAVGDNDFANLLSCGGEALRMPFSRTAARWPAAELLASAEGIVKHISSITIWSQLSLLLVAIAKSAGLPGLINPRGSKLPVDSPEGPEHVAALCRAYDDCRARVVALLGEEALTPRLAKL